MPINAPRTPAAMPPAQPIAAILYTPTDNIEALLMEVARALAAQGVRLGGVIQHDIPTVIDDPCAMELEDLETGECFALSQDLGSGSVACRLDTDALAHGAVAIRGAIDRGAELIVINKFGAQEASGGGLRDEMGIAAASAVPLLTAVGERFLPEWDSFTGGDSTLLPPRLDSVLQWWSALQAGS